MFDNRRKDSRYPIQSKVTVTMNDVILDSTECANISTGGMCINAADRGEHADTGMLILVHKCNNEVILFRADFTVSWSKTAKSHRNNSQMGISFTNIDKDNIKALNQIVSFQASCHN